MFPAYVNPIGAGIVSSSSIFVVGATVVGATVVAFSVGATVVGACVVGTAVVAFSVGAAVVVGACVVVGNAVVTWMFWVRQGKYYKIVTFGFKYPYAHPVLRFLN